MLSDIGQIDRFRGIHHMDKMEFDNTRKAIKAHDLKENDRKELIQKFTGAGGKVLTERALKEEQSGATRKRSEGGEKRGSSGGFVDNRLPSEIAREKNRKELEKQNEIQKALAREEAEARSFINRFIIRVKARMAGIAGFSQQDASPYIMSRINLDVKRALMEANITANDLFMANPGTGKQIIKELDDKNPVYVELIEKGADLYDRLELARLTDDYNSNPDTPVPFVVIKPPLYSLLKKLYMMKPYQETYLISVEQGINIQQKLEKKQAALYASKKKKIRSDWDTLMNEIYPKLVLLLQRIELVKAEPGSRIFEELLGISPVERVGLRKKGDPVGGIDSGANDKSEEKPEEAEEKTEEEEGNEELLESVEEAEDISIEVARGMDIMETLRPENLAKKLDQRNEFHKFSIRDKVFLSFLLFRFFEEEYSFILTTAKIRFNATYRDGRKIDMKRTMSDMMEHMRIIYDLFKKYVHDIEEYNKGVNDGAMTNNYVEHAKRMQLLEGRRGSTGRELRQKIKDFMTVITYNFEMMIQDMKGGNKEIVENKDDNIKFDNPVITGGRLDGKTIEVCIKEANDYCRALEHRIDKGDLYGGVMEMSLTDYVQAFPYSEPPEEAKL